MKYAKPFIPIILLPLLFITLSFNCGNGSAKQGDAERKPVPAATISEQQFNTLFPNRDKLYTYKAFVQAVNDMAAIKIKITKRAYQALQMVRTDKRTGKSSVVRQDEGFNEDWAKSKPDSVYIIDYGLFCNERDATLNKRELAAFFAHIAHETRHGINGEYNDGLMLKTEADTGNAYVVPNDEYPPVKGKKYYGRGPLQLSYNGNYGYASHCIFGNKETLLNNPELIEQDAVVAFKTAIYFWMTPQSPKPSAHDAITGKWKPTAAEKAAGRVPGFGSTINIINGAVECGKGDASENMQDRIGFYRHFLPLLGAADENCACSCGSMKAYTY